ncbi:MAG: KUP/HAK/KT family potassium transporter [Bacteroidia bacterium]|nr:KUP/HAK/KT family potassium transporter [Bacteroidia bacterium]
MDIQSIERLNRLTVTSFLVALGIIYGDIGTSPLYVMSAIVGDDPINSRIILGALSAIFWTLTFQTTIKYVVVMLRADNKGEGGIFALYTLVKRTKFKWLIFPALIGGGSLLADGIITPPISVSAALEGLKYFNPNFNPVPLVILVLFILFFIQQFGTHFVGKSFGPAMLIWFLMLGIVGFVQIMGNFSIFKALNPIYAIELLKTHPKGIFIMGAVFLCTTGAEALYSDMGHCGKRNIRATWIFVKMMLLINYFGQGAWLIAHEGQRMSEFRSANPFYAIVPDFFLPYSIVIATAAAIIASQAMITGSFTLINEAMRLNLWPKMKVKYPTELRGQIYIPALNWLMLAGCIFITLYFKKSENMEAAYGMAIITTFMMSTTLLNFYLHMKKYPFMFIMVFIAFYIVLEGMFFIANLGKFTHGGWLTLLIAFSLSLIMIIWHFGKKIRHRYIDFVKLDEHIPALTELSKDESIPKYATHLVYLTAANRVDEIESKVLYSIFHKRPKRADIYWFVHVDVKDEPYRMDYRVTHIVPNDIIRVDFKLGFRVAPRLNLMFRKVVEDLVKNGEVDITSRYTSLQKYNIIGDFKFVVIEKIMSYDNELPIHEKMICNAYEVLKSVSLSEESAFGLDSASVKVEKFPLVLKEATGINLRRLE